MASNIGDNILTAAGNDGQFSGRCDIWAPEYRCRNEALTEGRMVDGSTFAKSHADRA